MSERKARLKEIVVDRMNLKIAASEIGDEQALFGDGEGSLGLDSIDALDLVVGIYEEFDVEIQESDMSVFHNVNTLDGFIESWLAQRVA
ncbi:MAG: acyl carrier protein [Thermoanaerobaculia bacterium]|nr:acyl carrier protein [Thermoanaerobaculia bacterium]